MKRILTFLLALCMIFSMVACNTAAEEPLENKTEIVGEWIGLSGNAYVVFREDGTGELQTNDTQNITWRYDAKRDCYIVTADQDYDAIFFKEYDLEYVKFMGIDFCRSYDYDTAFTIMQTRRYDDIAILTAEMTELELHTVYNLGNGVSVSFSEITESVDGNGLQIMALFTNESEQTANNIEPIAFNSKCYLFGSSVPATNTLTPQWSFLNTGLVAGACISETVTLFSANNVAQTVKNFREVVGAVYFQMNGTNYFINLKNFFH